MIIDAYVEDGTSFEFVLILDTSLSFIYTMWIHGLIAGVQRHALQHHRPVENHNESMECRPNVTRRDGMHRDMK